MSYHTTAHWHKCEPVCCKTYPDARCTCTSKTAYTIDRAPRKLYRSQVNDRSIWRSVSKNMQTTLHKNKVMQSAVIRYGTINRDAATAFNLLCLALAQSKRINARCQGSPHNLERYGSRSPIYSPMSRSPSCRQRCECVQGGSRPLPKNTRRTPPNT